MTPADLDALKNEMAVFGSVIGLLNFFFTIYVGGVVAGKWR